MIYRLLVLLIFIFTSCKQVDSEVSVESEMPVKKDYTRFHSEALEFSKEKGFSPDYYFLVDLGLHSGKKRFFVYDFSLEKITEKGLATHGSCDVFEENAEKYKKVRFSNRNNSHCSSQGKYKIGKRDYSSWGINVKYWLHGLEDTNSNAVQRVVVLHSWSAVSDNEIYPRYSPLSWGCPAVSDEFMKILDEKLKQTQKPVLLWIID